MERTRLDRILLRLGLIDEAQLRHALDRQRQRGGRLGTHLVELRVITQEQLVMALSEQFGVPSVMPTTDSVDRSLVDALPPRFVLEHAVLPLHRDTRRGALSLAVADPSDTEAIEQARSLLGAKSTITMVAPESVIVELGSMLSREPQKPIELPELFDPASSGAIAAVAADAAGNSGGSDLRNVLMVSASTANRNFLPAIFIREGWRLHVVENRDEFEEACREKEFERVLVAQNMAESFVGWMKECNDPGLGSRVSVFPTVSAALLENPAPYRQTTRSIKLAAQMILEQRCQQTGLRVPYGLIARDLELLARRSGLRELAIDGLEIALHFLLPGEPFADFPASVDAARRLKFPWRIDAVLEHCAELFASGQEGARAESRSGEVQLAGEILAVCWYRHVELHLPDAPVEEQMNSIKQGLRRRAGHLASVELIESYLRQIGENGQRISGDGEHQILVVGDSPGSVRPLVSRLRRIGYQPIAAVDPADAQTMIARRAPAAILFDHESFEAEAENFCRVHGLNPESLLYMVRAHDDPAATLSLLDAGADDVFSPAHDPDLCVARIDRALRSRASQVGVARPAPGQITASLGAFSFAGLLQSLGHGLKSVRIKLTSATGETAVVYLQDGRLLHATCGELEGEDAIYRIVAWQDEGDFVVLPTKQFPAPNIHVPLEAVLMEGCRMLDESLA